MDEMDEMDEMDTYSKKENLNIPKYMLSNTCDARRSFASADFYAFITYFSYHYGKNIS
jgi:hypothetical protein